MKVTILGSGGAAGVPSISIGWGRCDPNNPRNRRRRPSIMVEQGETRLLVDTSPDLRAQLLDAEVKRLDGVLYTHDHADHLHGIDDLREVNRAMKAAIPIWGTPQVLETIGQRFGYVLEPLPEGTDTIYKPLLEPRVIDGPFRIGEINVIPFDQDHGYCRTTGFRFGKLAYSTDVVELPEAAFKALEGVEVWIVGCLLNSPHPTHAHVDKVLEWIKRVGAARVVLTHMGTGLDSEALRARLPAHAEPGYDGMVIEVAG